MDNETYETLVNGMEIIGAKTLLKSFSVADYPNGKADSRRKLHRKIFKVAYPNDAKKRALKVSDLKGIPDAAEIIAKRKNNV